MTAGGKVVARTKKKKNKEPRAKRQAGGAGFFEVLEFPASSDSRGGRLEE